MFCLAFSLDVGIRKTLMTREELLIVSYMFLMKISRQLWARPLMLGNFSKFIMKVFFLMSRETI